jgi:hypothetical protein
MIKAEEPYPPPLDWFPVFISWDRMLKQQPNVQDLLYWIEVEYQGHGQYQLRGPEKDPESGFLFYFENIKDAIIFVLKWSS